MTIEFRLPDAAARAARMICIVSLLGVVHGSASAAPDAGMHANGGMSIASPSVEPVETPPAPLPESTIDEQPAVAIDADAADIADIADVEDAANASTDAESSDERPPARPLGPRDRGNADALATPDVIASPDAEGVADGESGNGIVGMIVSWWSGLPPTIQEVTRTGGALVVVIGLLLFLRAVIRRSGGVFQGGARPSGVLEVLARYPIARGQTLMVLKLGRRCLLVHHARDTMRTLAEVSDSEDVADLLGRMAAGARSGDAKRFRQLLEQFDAAETAGTMRSAAPARLTESVRSGDAGIEIVDLTKRRPRARTLRGRTKASPGPSQIS